MPGPRDGRLLPYGDGLVRPIATVTVAQSAYVRATIPGSLMTPRTWIINIPGYIFKKYKYFNKITFCRTSPPPLAQSVLP